LARLLAAGVVETTRLCALTASPFAQRNPSAAASEYEPYAAAAAQWILCAGPALYEMCVKDVVFQIGKKKWTLTLWESWKTKFDAVTRDDRYGSATQEMTAKALERMAQLERDGVTEPGVVAKFNPAISNDMQEQE